MKPVITCINFIKAISYGVYIKKVKRPKRTMPYGSLINWYNRVIASRISHRLVIMRQSKQEINADVHVNANDLKCPKPVISAKQKINKMKVRETIHVTTLDPLSVHGFEKSMGDTGNLIIDSWKNGDEFNYWVEKHNNIEREIKCTRQKS
jgi:TusA-related sulfurtransferase